MFLSLEDLRHLRSWSNQLDDPGNPAPTAEKGQTKLPINTPTPDAPPVVLSVWPSRGNPRHSAFNIPDAPPVVLWGWVWGWIYSRTPVSTSPISRRIASEIARSETSSIANWKDAMKASEASGRRRCRALRTRGHSSRGRPA